MLLLVILISCLMSTYADETVCFSVGLVVELWGEKDPQNTMLKKVCDVLARDLEKSGYSSCRVFCRHGGVFKFKFYLLLPIAAKEHSRYYCVD